MEIESWNWEFEYGEFLENLGFEKGKATPCAFHNSEYKLRIVVHGDDFTVLGNENNLDWFRRMISMKYEVKFRGRIGPEENDA